MNEIMILQTVIFNLGCPEILLVVKGRDCPAAVLLVKRGDCMAAVLFSVASLRDSGERLLVYCSYVVFVFSL